MDNNRQAIEETIGRLEEVLAQMEQENQFQQGDMVNFTHEGQQGVASVENVSEQGYTIRVMAVAGDSYEPTDDVYVVSAESLSALANDSGEKPEQETEEEPEEEIVEKSYVMWQSQHGATQGRVVEITCDPIIVLPDTGDEVANSAKKKHAVIEVYADNDGYEATNVHVALLLKDIQAIDPLPVKMSRIMVKMRKYDLDEQEQDKNIHGFFKGLGSAYGKVDLGGDTVCKGAYTQTISHNEGKVPLMFDHGWKVGDVAGIAYLQDSEEGLQVEGKMPLHISSVKDGFAMIKFMHEEGKPLGLSIGYFPVKSEPGPNGTRLLKEIAVEEMTVTPWPMDTHARIRDAKERKIAYNTKRRGWQSVVPAKSDAPTGNQGNQDDYKSLGSFLREIKTYMET